MQETGPALAPWLPGCNLMVFARPQWRGRALTHHLITRSRRPLACGQWHRRRERTLGIKKGNKTNTARPEISSYIFYVSDVDDCVSLSSLFSRFLTLSKAIKLMLFERLHEYGLLFVIASVGPSSPLHDFYTNFLFRQLSESEEGRN